MERETQTSTFLGNGIATPHGTTATRHLVQNTGVQVFQYPQGIDWGEGQTAYVVIGIAARSDEHLALLRQLTHVLSDEALAARLAKTDSAEELSSVLMGQQQPAAFLFDSSTMILDIAAGDLMTLKALNAGLLQRLGAVDTGFVSDVAISRPATPFADNQPLPVLDYLAALVRQGSVGRLTDADAPTLLPAKWRNRRISLPPNSWCAMSTGCMPGRARCWSA